MKFEIGLLSLNNNSLLFDTIFFTNMGHPVVMNPVDIGWYLPARLRLINAINRLQLSNPN